MKTIGVIAAMEKEISELRGRLEIVSVKNIAGADFYMGKLAGKSAVIAKCGVGKVNAAVCSQILIDMYAVDYIINAGVAGGVARGLKVGDIVVSTGAAHHDFDTCAFGDEPGFISGPNKKIFESDEVLTGAAALSAETALKSRGNPGKNAVHKGIVASGDQFIAGSEKKERIAEVFGAACVEMEGAAIAQTCWLNKIPFVIIRSVSDLADGGAAEGFSEFISGAAGILADIVELMVKSL